MSIVIIGTAPYYLLAKRSENQVFAATIDDITKALRVKEYINPLPLLSKEYYKFVDVFSR